MNFRIVTLLVLAMVGVGLAQSPIDGVQGLYQWYLENPDTVGQRLTSAESLLEPELARLLAKAYEAGTLEKDPFVNSTEPARTFAFNDLKQSGSEAVVTVQAVFESGLGPGYDVLLIKDGERWRVSDIKFPEKALKAHLQEMVAEASPVFTRPEPSPSPPPAAGFAEADLLGTWLHFSTSDTLGSEQKPMAPVEVKWTFEPGGRGEFSQKVSIQGNPWINPLSWSLEGRTILLSGGRTRYTIVRSEADSMVWENKAQGNFYHVRRLGP